MNFKFYSVESKLYDFLKFPRALFYREGYKETKEDHNYKELLIDDYLDLVKTIEGKIKPYEKEIEVFYMKDFLSEYDFIDLISRANSIFGYKDEKDYLDMLLTLNDKDINQSIIYSIMMISGDCNQYSNEIMDKAEEISLNKDEVVSFIKDLPIDPASKWNLFLIVEKPIEHMKMYVDLMNRLLPIFHEIYLPFVDEVKEYGDYLVDFLNINGPKGLEEMTYSIIDGNIIEGEQINILISVMFSYAISIMTMTEDKYLAWGLKMEKAFKIMKEINENKTNERVQIFKNLGDKTRYEALKLIASGETSTKVIAQALGVSSATISYHINNFLTSKVIKMDKSDNKYGYVVDYGLLEDAIKGFKEDLRFPST